jgi:hypothetical protein
LVTNDEAVLKLRSHVPEWKPSGFHGWSVWVRRMRNSSSHPASEKKMTPRA